MSRWIGLSVAAGLLSALLFLSVMAGMGTGVVFSYLAPLPMLMAGLSLGLYGAAIGSTVGAIAVLAGTNWFTLAAYSVAVILPALVISRQALLWRQDPGKPVEWYPPGHVLAWLAAAGVGAMGVLALAVPSEEGVEALVQGMVDRMMGAVPEGLSAGERAQLSGLITSLLPGMVGASWLVMSCINAALAQALAVRLKMAQRPNPAYADLDLPDWLLFAMVAVILVGATADGDLGYVAGNAGALLAVPFGIQGVAVLHGLIKARAPRPVLFVFYAAFALLFKWAAIPVVVVGLGRQLMRLWRRVTAHSGKED